MPLVHVEIVVAQDALRATLAQELADRIGEVLQAPPGQCVVTVRPIPAVQYAENGTGASEDGPVFVTIRRSKLPLTDKLQREVTSLTQVVALVCGRREQSVHIIYQPDGAGRVAFGGTLVTG